MTWRCLTNILWIISLTHLLSSCMVGPNFQSPKPPLVSRYTAEKLPTKTVSSPLNKNGGKAQYYAFNQDIPEKWWYLFRSHELNSLIEAGLTNSPNLAAAQSALRQAQEILTAQIGSTLLPTFDSQFSGERQRFSGATIGNDSPNSIFNLFNATVSVSYTLDVFGGARREIESLQAQVDYQQFQLIASYLTLTANIVTTAITIASLEEQIKATKQLITEQDDQLAILNHQFRLGAISQITVLTQQSLVDQTRATLPPLQKSLSQSRHALSVLIGEFPNTPMPIIRLDHLNLPRRLPVSLPSRLVRQRPDVRASEALLHAASAQIGVATANLFPQFTLTGNYGWSAPAPSALFSSTSNVWMIAGNIAQPIFHGGALFAKRRAAIDAYQLAAAQYRQTVLQSFQNVADSLRALETDARTLQATRHAELATYRNLKLTEEQYRLGGVSYLFLLTAQRQYQQTKIERIRAQAARYTDTAALFQALGGGWWNRMPVCSDAVNPTRASLVCP